MMLLCVTPPRAAAFSPAWAPGRGSSPLHRGSLPVCGEEQRADPRQPGRRTHFQGLPVHPRALGDGAALVYLPVDPGAPRGRAARGLPVDPGAPCGRCSPGVSPWTPSPSQTNTRVSPERSPVRPASGVTVPRPAAQKLSTRPSRRPNPALAYQARSWLRRWPGCRPAELASARHGPRTRTIRASAASHTCHGDA